MLRLNKIILILISLFVMGCNINNTTDSIDKSGVVEESGILSFVVPSISPKVAEEFRVKEEDQRAFVVSSSVKISIYNTSDELTFQNNYQSGENIDIVLNPGSYYLYMEVFNGYISYEVPVVHGYSDSFEIIAGTITNTHIMLTPVSPVVLNESTSQIVECTYFGYGDAYDNAIYSYASEYWYSITAVSNATIVEVLDNTPGIKSAVVIAYNNLGELIASSDFYTDLVFESIVGEEYYIAVIPVEYYDDGTVTPAEVSIMWSQFDLSDNDNSVETATSMTTDGVNVNSTLFNDDSDYYSISVTEGNTYNLQNDSSQELSITVINSSSEIIDSFTVNNSHTISANYTGTLYFQVSDSTAGINTYNFSVLEKVIIPITTSNEWQVLDVVHNEVELYSFIVTPGSTYSLSWDSSWEGSGAFSADVIISVYDTYGNTYVESTDSGYYNPKIFTIPDGITNIIIEIDGYYWGGDLGVLLQDVSS